MGVAKQARRPALLAGAAAGLAAALNTPLSAITFVLEEIVEDLNNTRFLVQALVAAVAATLVSYYFLGDDPAFAIPVVPPITWQTLLAVVPVTACAAAIGVLFQKVTLAWRGSLQTWQGVPDLFKPFVGGLINWTFGVAAFLVVGRLGVFGLGYGDLSDMFFGNVSGPAALVLLFGKLAATVAAYAWGGAGGIRPLPVCPCPRPGSLARDTGGSDRLVFAGLRSVEPAGSVSADSGEASSPLLSSGNGRSGSRCD